MDSTIWKSKIIKENLTKDFNYTNIHLPGDEPLMNPILNKDILCFNGKCDPDRPYKEGFEETINTSDVYYEQDTDVRENVETDANEKIIMEGGVRDTAEPDKKEGPKKADPSPKKKGFLDRIDNKIPDLIKSGIRMGKKPSKQNLQLLLIDIINFGPACFNWLIHLVALCIVYPFFSNDMDSKGAIDAIDMIVNQLYKLLTIPVALFITFNWWYTINYTNHYIDFTKILESKVFNIVYYIIEPIIYVLDTINYYILGLRVDSELSPGVKEFLNKLWEYRPITASIVFYICGIIFYGATYSTLTTDFIAGKKPAGYYVILAIIMVTFLYLTPFNRDRQLGLTMTLGNFLFVIFAFIIMLLFVMLSALLSLFVFQGYFLFYSMFAMTFLYSMNPLSIFKMISKMREDIRDIPVEPSTEKNRVTRFYIWLKNILFKNALEININLVPGLLAFLFGIQSYTKYKSDKPIFATTLAIVYMVMSAIFMTFFLNIGTNIFSKMKSSLFGDKEETLSSTETSNPSAFEYAPSENAPPNYQTIPQNAPPNYGPQQYYGYPLNMNAYNNGSLPNQQSANTMFQQYMTPGKY